MKGLVFLADSGRLVMDFPRKVQDRMLAELYRVCMGIEPMHWKAMQSIGPGVREIRVRLSGAWRVIYLDSREDVVYVLHAFQKKDQKTRRSDIEKARERLKRLK